MARVPRVVVIGGGISGLAAAHRLTELAAQGGVALDLTVLEGEDRLGGVIQTVARDGYLFEAGPDAWITDTPWASDLCRRLGIGDDIIQTQPEHRRSFLVRNGALMPVPAGWHLVVPATWSALWSTSLLTWRGKLRVAAEPWVRARRDDADESVGQFVRRRFGQEAFARIGAPMLGGIYTADPDQLSMESTLPRWRRLEREYGSLIRGLRASQSAAREAAKQASGPRYQLFVTLRGGVGRLIEALRARLAGVAIRCGAPVVGLDRAAGEWTVRVAGADALAADAVCLAMPADRAGVLLRTAAPALAHALMQLPAESVATVNLAYPRAAVPHPLDGFGCVVPADAGRRILGCTFSSVKFAGRAPSDAVVIRAFLGGAAQRHWLALDDAAMMRLVRDELRELLGVTAPPAAGLVSRFLRAMPQYLVGHRRRVEGLMGQAASLPGLWLTGNAYAGIGIPDCIQHAEATAQKLFARLTLTHTRAT